MVNVIGNKRFEKRQKWRFFNHRY